METLPEEEVRESITELVRTFTGKFYIRSNPYSSFLYNIIKDKK